jgi:membrane associated rhomboid family serine protease
MGSIRDDIRIAFNKGNSSSVQLILVNAFVFVGYMLVKLILSMTPETSELVNVISQNFFLNAEFPQLILHPWSIFTFGFINSSFFGFLFNCVALYWFGFLIQDFLGNRKLINVYFLGYIFAGLFYILAFSLISFSNATFTLPSLISGSTAAVYAVMFATITLIPDYELFFFRMFRLKIKYIALGLLVFSFFNPSAGLLNLGGAFLGYLYIKLLRTGIDLGSPIEAVQEWFGGLSNQKTEKSSFNAKKFSHSTVGKVGGVHLETETDRTTDQEEVDALLDKISVSGYKSLTLEEKERLYKASQSDKL